MHYFDLAEGVNGDCADPGSALKPVVIALGGLLACCVVCFGILIFYVNQKNVCKHSKGKFNIFNFSFQLKLDFWYANSKVPALVGFCIIGSQYLGNKFITCLLNVCLWPLGKKKNNIYNIYMYMSLQAAARPNTLLWALSTLQA